MILQCQCPNMKESECKVNKYLLDIQLGFLVHRKDGNKTYRINVEKLPGFVKSDIRECENLFKLKCAQCVQRQK